LTDDRADAGARQSLRRVLARGSAAEIGVDDEDRRALVARVVEGVGLVGAAIVLEQVVLEPFERHDLEEARRHDAIGVDVVAAQRQAAAFDAGDRGAHAGAPSNTSRTSTTSPAIAAAATIAGLISSVRPVGLPCR